MANKTFEFVVKDCKEDVTCEGCKHEGDSPDICKLRDCWRAIEPKEAYEEGEELMEWKEAIKVIAEILNNEQPTCRTYEELKEAATRNENALKLAIQAIEIIDRLRDYRNSLMFDLGMHDKDFCEYDKGRYDGVNLAIDLFDKATEGEE